MLRFTLPALIGLVLLAGCHEEPPKRTGKLIPANIAKIHKGMTAAEAEAILGGDDTSKPSGFEMNGVNVPADMRTWKDGDATFAITFVGGQAVSWEDLHEP